MVEVDRASHSSNQRGERTTVLLALMAMRYTRMPIAFLLIVSMVPGLFAVIPSDSAQDFPAVPNSSVDTTSSDGFPIEAAVISPVEYSSAAVITPNEDSSDAGITPVEDSSDTGIYSMIRSQITHFVANRRREIVASVAALAAVSFLVNLNRRESPRSGPAPIPDIIELVALSDASTKDTEENLSTIGMSVASVLFIGSRIVRRIPKPAVPVREQEVAHEFANAEQRSDSPKRSVLSIILAVLAGLPAAYILIWICRCLSCCVGASRPEPAERIEKIPSWMYLTPKSFPDVPVHLAKAFYV